MCCPERGLERFCVRHKQLHSKGFGRSWSDQILAVTKKLGIGVKGGIIGVLKRAIIFPIFKGVGCMNERLLKGVARQRGRRRQ